MLSTVHRFLHVVRHAADRPPLLWSEASFLGAGDDVAADDVAADD
jgi:hypothetical protein